MKRTFFATLLILLLPAVSGYAVDAVGSSFGTLTTAQALGLGQADFGFGIGLADRTSFVGTFAYGLSQYTDGRIRIGLVDPDHGDTEFTIGADFKWQFWNYGVQTDHLFDFAVGGFAEYVDFSGWSVFQVGGHLIGSYPITLTKGGILSPYGRFNARLEHVSNGDSESNLKIGLNAGVAWEATATISFLGEFQIDGNDGVFFGVDFNVM